jgi:hypothetical protein
MAVIPDDHRSATVFAFWDNTLETEILERVIFGAYRETLLSGEDAWTVWDGPTEKNAVQFQAKVIVRPPRIVPLNDETRFAVACNAGFGLGRAGEISFPAIARQPIRRRRLHRTRRNL